MQKNLKNILQQLKLLLQTQYTNVLYYQKRGNIGNNKTSIIIKPQSIFSTQNFGYVEYDFTVRLILVLKNVVNNQMLTILQNVDTIKDILNSNLKIDNNKLIQNIPQIVIAIGDDGIQVDNVDSPGYNAGTSVTHITIRMISNITY